MRHIDNFTIHRFRGIREAKLAKLGQINLLVGGNNSGKTSVLEAISIFCDPLNSRKWTSVAVARETSPSISSRSDRLLWLFPQEGLFPQEKLFPDDGLFPRETISDSQLLLSASGAFPLKRVSAHQEWFSEVIKGNYRPNLDDDTKQSDEFVFEEREREVEGIKIQVDVSYRDNPNALTDEVLTRTYKFPEYGLLPRENLREVRSLPVRLIHSCSHRSSGGPSELWTDVIYAGMKLQTIKLLKLFDPDIQDVDIISPRERASISIQHKKLGRAPLSAFGDGLRRVFTLASAIPGVKDGILLVDELEIAVHSRMQEKTFNWLVKACNQFNVQLFVTTHSLEAIDAMIDACKGKEIDLVGYRLQKGEVQTTTKRFDKEYLTQLREELGVDLRW